jgi:hypothetical protein
MSFQFLTDDAHLELDGELQRLLGSLCQSPPEPYGALASRALGIIQQAVKGKLVGPGWERSWDWRKSVDCAWFGDVDNDEKAAALLAVFVELVRYVRSAKTPHRQQGYARQLTDALQEYLSLRGCPISAEPATDGRDQGGAGKGEGDKPTANTAPEGAVVARPDAAPDCYVTLDKMAAMVDRSKRTLEKLQTRQQTPLPAPDVEGGGGRPHEWKWSNIRLWLEKEFGRVMPEQFPSDRFRDARADRS